MMIIKSFALGLGMFFIGTIVYLILMLGALTPPPAGGNRAIGLSVLQGYTIYNVWCWLWLVASLGIGYWVVRRGSAKRA
jgi:hypothetical protein